MVTSINKLAVVRISHQGLTLETKSQDIIHSAVYTVCVCVCVYSQNAEVNFSLVLGATLSKNERRS